MRRKMTLADIGRGLGISRQRVHALRAKGMPVDSIRAAQEWRAEHLDPDLMRPDPRSGTRSAGAADDGGWRARLGAARAAREEFALVRERGEFFGKAEVLATWQRRFADVRTRLLAIPNTVGARTRPEALRDEVLLAVETEIYNALLDVSGTAAESEAGAPDA